MGDGVEAGLGGSEAIRGAYLLWHALSDGRLTICLGSNPLVRGSHRSDSCTKSTISGRYALYFPTSHLDTHALCGAVPQHGGTKDDPGTSMERRWMERDGSTGMPPLLITVDAVADTQARRSSWRDR